MKHLLVVIILISALFAQAESQVKNESRIFDGNSLFGLFTEVNEIPIVYPDIPLFTIQFHLSEFTCFKNPMISVNEQFSIFKSGMLTSVRKDNSALNKDLIKNMIFYDSRFLSFLEEKSPQSIYITKIEDMIFDRKTLLSGSYVIYSSR